MLNLFDESSSKGFVWEDIGDIVDGRTQLGQEMPVYVYRLFQYTIKDVINQTFDKQTAISIFRRAGQLSGKEFAEHMLDLTLPLPRFVAQLQDVLECSKIGILRVEKFDPETGAATLTVSEDLDCSGLPVTGETVCNYDEGFLAGILQAYTKKDYFVTEVDCWGTGSRVCRFNAVVLSQKGGL